MTAKHSEKKVHRHFNVPFVIAIFLLIAGLCVILYPYISQWVYDREASQGFEQFLAEVEKSNSPSKDAPKMEAPTSAEKGMFVPTKYAELYRQMQVYNAGLYNDAQSGLIDAWSYQNPAFDITSYGHKNNIIGYIQIPAIDLTLPIYLGANDMNMSMGAAHLSQTSVPIGGVNTNSVICGHKGYSQKILFDRLLELKEGDEVLITNLWQTIRYHVTSSTTIRSDEVDKLKIQEGKDMLSLFTCYYQQGRRDRYVVYCERNIEDA